MPYPIDQLRLKTTSEVILFPEVNSNLTEVILKNNLWGYLKNNLTVSAVVLENNIRMVYHMGCQDTCFSHWHLEVDLWKYL